MEITDFSGPLSSSLGTYLASLPSWHLNQPWQISNQTQGQFFGWVHFLVASSLRGCRYQLSKSPGPSQNIPQVRFDTKWSMDPYGCFTSGAPPPVSPQKMINNLDGKLGVPYDSKNKPNGWAVSHPMPSYLHYFHTSEILKPLYYTEDNRHVHIYIYIHTELYRYHTPLTHITSSSMVHQWLNQWFHHCFHQWWTSKPWHSFVLVLNGAVICLCPGLLHSTSLIPRVGVFLSKRQP